MTRKLLLALAAAAIAAGVVLALRAGKSPHRAASTVARATEVTVASASQPPLTRTACCSTLVQRGSVQSVYP